MCCCHSSAQLSWNGNLVPLDAGPRTTRESYDLLRTHDGPKDKAEDAAFNMACENELAYAHNGLLCMLIDQQSPSWRAPFHRFPQLARLMGVNHVSATLPHLSNEVELPAHTSVIMAGPPKMKFGSREVEYKSATNMRGKQLEEQNECLGLTTRPPCTSAVCACAPALPCR